MAPTGDGCVPNPCLHGGDCHLDNGMPVCSCHGAYGSDCGITITDFAIGAPNVCALLSDSTITCFGASVSLHPNRTPRGTFLSVVAFSAGQSLCGVRTDQAIDCWTFSDLDGVAQPPPGTFRAVSVGDFHTCGLHPNGKVECWGSDVSGELDAPPGPFTAITSGSGHTCGLGVNGVAECWGVGDLGQTSAPTTAFKAIAAGDVSTCGLRADGHVECWGDDSYGQSSPPANEFVEIGVGHSHGCGRSADGSVTCWGTDPFGHPAEFPGRFKKLSVGYAGTCGIDTTGAAVCAGDFESFPPYAPKTLARTVDEQHAHRPTFAPHSSDRSGQ